MQVSSAIELLRIFGVRARQFMKQHQHLWWLMLILAIGAFLRFYRLDQVPPGLWYDEAFYADAAMRFLQQGPELIYFMRNESQIGLFPCLLAAGFWLMGDSLAALRATVAIWGMLGIVGCYLLCLELFLKSRQRQMIALGATFLLATSYWHVNYSRLVFSTSLVPTFEVFALWLTLLAFRLNRPLPAAIAGGMTALGLYSYWPYYIFPVMLGGIALIYLWQQRKVFAYTFAIYVLVGMMVLFPLIHAFLHYPMVELLRHKIIFSGPDLPIWHAVVWFSQNAWQHVLMLFWQGDGNWRHNFAGAPGLSLFAATGFCVALGVLLLPRALPIMLSEERHALWLLLTWVLLALIPAALSNAELPHASRSIGMLVPCQIIAAFGYVILWRQVSEWCRSMPALALCRYSLLVSIAAAALLQIALLATQYFVVFPHDGGAKASFQILDEGYLKHRFAREAQQIGK